MSADTTAPDEAQANYRQKISHEMALRLSATGLYRAEYAPLLDELADREIKRLEEQVRAMSEAATLTLRPLSEAPRDGSPFNVRVIHTHRWLPYKGNSQEYKRGKRGRWQRATEYGWENCLEPDCDGWQPLRSPKTTTEGKKTS